MQLVTNGDPRASTDNVAAMTVVRRDIGLVHWVHYFRKDSELWIQGVDLKFFSFISTTRYSLVSPDNFHPLRSIGQTPNRFELVAGGVLLSDSASKQYWADLIAKEEEEMEQDT